MIKIEFEPVCLYRADELPEESMYKIINDWIDSCAREGESCTEQEALDFLNGLGCQYTLQGDRLAYPVLVNENKIRVGFPLSIKSARLV